MPKKTRQLYKIPSPYQDLADSKVAELIKMLNLAQSHGNLPLTGNRPLENNSKEAYYKHFRGLRYYCTLVGDYERILMLLDKPPEP